MDQQMMLLGLMQAFNNKHHNDYSQLIIAMMVFALIIYILKQPQYIQQHPPNNQFQHLERYIQPSISYH